MPLWFGNQFSDTEENPTYGTSRVLLVVGATAAGEQIAARLDVTRGLDWLLRAQNDDGGWGGDLNTPSTIEETAFAVDALASLLQVDRTGKYVCQEERPRMRAAVGKGVTWLCERTLQGTSFPPAPIGFYFAKLWYYERLYPLAFTVAALGRARRNLCS